MMNSPNQFKKKLDDEEATLAIAKHIAQLVKSGAIIFLHGPLGAGKTTFARGFLQGLGFKGKVKSPTYTLVEPYEINGIHIFHFDFFRLKGPTELDQIGIEEYFSNNAICLIEWAEKAFPALPSADIGCFLAFDGEARKIRVVGYSEKGDQILRYLKDNL